MQPSPWASASFLRDWVKVQHELFWAWNIYPSAWTDAMHPQFARIHSLIRLIVLSTYCVPATTPESRNATHLFPFQLGVAVIAPVLMVISVSQLKVSGS